MSKLLFDEQPILIDRTLAKLIGFNESIVVQQVHYWIRINEGKGRISSRGGTGPTTA